MTQASIPETPNSNPDEFTPDEILPGDATPPGDDSGPVPTDPEVSETPAPLEPDMSLASSETEPGEVIPPVPPRNWMEQVPSSWEGFQALVAEINENRNSRRSFRRWLGNLDESDSARRGIGLFAVGDAVRALAPLNHVEGDLGQLLLGKAKAENHDPVGALKQWASVASKPGVGRQASLWALELHARRFEAEEAEAAVAAFKTTGTPSPADISYAEGLAVEASGDHAGAVASWRVTLQHDPNHASALFSLAYRLDLQGEDEEAMELYKRFLGGELRPHTGALINLGILYEDQDDYRNARRCYQLIVDSEPTNLRAQRYLADAEASMGQYYDESRERKVDKHNAVLRIPVTDFELSVRARNCLQRMNIHTLGDLVCRTESELLSFKNFGETSLQEVKEILGVKGLRLGMLPAPQASAPAVVGDSGDIRTKGVSELDLSVRSRTALSTLGLHTVGDLLATSPTTLMSCKNFGQTSLDEIKRKLAELNLNFEA